MVRRQIFVMAGLAASATVAQAADVPVQAGAASPWTMSASLGHLSGVAHEMVYLDHGRKLSQLDWNMEQALVLNGGMSFEATDLLRFYGAVSFGLDGDNYMDDYDWIDTPPSGKPNLHSWHPDTELDHYYTIDAGASFLLMNDGQNNFSALGGFKYTDVQWTAYGGCYDYKYYDAKGCIADGAKVITYRQSLPAVYGGLGYRGGFDRWTVALEGRAGMSLSSAIADDDHWLRDLKLTDDLNAAPYAALNGRVSYAVGTGADLFASIAYDKFFEMKGAKTYEDTVTGETMRFEDAGGADFYTLNIAVGLDYSF